MKDHKADRNNFTIHFYHTQCITFTCYNDMKTRGTEINEHSFLQTSCHLEVDRARNKRTTKKQRSFHKQVISTVKDSFFIYKSS